MKGRGRACAKMGAHSRSSSRNRLQLKTRPSGIWVPSPMGASFSAAADAPRSVKDKSFHKVYGALTSFINNAKTQHFEIRIDALQSY